MSEETYILFCLNVKKVKSLKLILGFGAVVTLSFIIGLILLPVFWTDIINSEYVTKWLQELLIVDDGHLTPDERKKLFKNLKDMITSIGLPVIVIFMFLFLALELYFNYILYGLYSNLNQANGEAARKTETLDRSNTAVQIRNRKSKLLADSIEMKS